MNAYMCITSNGRTVTIRAADAVAALKTAERATGFYCRNPQPAKNPDAYGLQECAGDVATADGMRGTEAVISGPHGHTLTLSLAGTAQADNVRALALCDALNDPMRAAHNDARRRARLAFDARDTKRREFWHRLAGSLLKAAAIIEEENAP